MVNLGCTNNLSVVADGFKHSAKNRSFVHRKSQPVTVLLVVGFQGFLGLHGGLEMTCLLEVCPQDIREKKGLGTAVTYSEPKRDNQIFFRCDRFAGYFAGPLSG
jgi:hypothetical protein